MYWSEFLTIAVAHLLAVASPGPDFVIVTRHSVAGGTRLGLWTSLGVGTGILLHVGYCILGVALLLSRSPLLFNAMKYLAAAYLCVLGIQSIRASFLPVPTTTDGAVADTSAGQAFRSGFLTNGLNPKATLFFLALFSAVIDIDTPTMIQLLYGGYLAFATFAWFALLSTVLGKPGVRQCLLRAGPWFDRAMGVVLLLLALQLIWWT